MSTAIDIITDGLAFPEGPIWMRDGSVAVVEIAAGRLTRVKPNGDKQRLAQTGGGPNGAAVGPGGMIFICNNGGLAFTRAGGLWIPGDQAADYDGGRIEIVDPETGRVERLYDHCDGILLRGPNDIVFDAHGGFYFTDIGKTREHDLDFGGVFYARADGSFIKPIARRVMHPNGCGLSPDGKMLYVALTSERLVLGFDLTGPGETAPATGMPGRVVTAFGGRQWLDSMAVTAAGHICVARLFEEPGIATVDPASGAITSFVTDDPITTNICFGGADMRDAWITLSSSGCLARTRWQEPGLVLNHYV